MGKDARIKRERRDRPKVATQNQPKVTLLIEEKPNPYTDAYVRGQLDAALAMLKWRGR